MVWFISVQVYPVSAVVPADAVTGSAEDFTPDSAVTATGSVAEISSLVLTGSSVDSATGTSVSVGSVTTSFVGSVVISVVVSVTGSIVSSTEPASVFPQAVSIHAAQRIAATSFAVYS